MSDQFRELSDLLGALCDQRLTEADRARLESLVLADRDALRFYLRYIQLHGMLHWDAAGGIVEASAAGLPTASSEALSSPLNRVAASADHRREKRRLMLAALAAAVCLMLGWSVFRMSPAGNSGDLTGNSPEALPSVPQVVAIDARPPNGEIRPEATVRLSPRNSPRSPGSSDHDAVANSSPREVIDRTVHDVANRSSESMVAVIDRELHEYWEDHNVTPSPVADDETWVRRVHLDLVGRIPEAEAVVTFVKDQRPDKRARLVDDLLASPEFARHYSVVWTNLLIGHTAPREVNRPALEKFLREQFHRNRPWSETVTKLISAEGREDENGAANFLLAHLNNEAVPATAVTARVLLCEQVQCTQCHNHPFVDWTQERFWQLNAFFQQTEIVRHRRTDPETGRPMRDRLELVSLDAGGPTFFEDRQARVQVAYPEFEGVTVDDAPGVNRRQELAKLLCSGDQPQVARALVNRMWGKFFGYAFTDPIDDMGPHNRAVLPELMDSLSSEFVRTGFDVKQLVRWICLSEPYQLAAATAAGNVVDDPETGNPPLFSRMYVKPLTAEQLFDSLLIATQADRAGARYWDEIETRRRVWLEQFYQALDNDENSEEDSFEGSLAQTLVMMNGDLIRQATAATPGTVLQQVLSQATGEEEQIRLLSLATLSRYPSADELASLKRVLRQQVQSRPREVPAQVALHEGLRDLMWAYLNSTEFRSNL